jgi:hypothetical protein
VLLLFNRPPGSRPFAVHKGRYYASSKSKYYAYSSTSYSRVVNEPSKVTWWTLPLIPLKKLFHYPIINSRNETKKGDVGAACLIASLFGLLSPSIAQRQE